MDIDGAIGRYVWLLWAALAGSISAQPFMRWKAMSWGERFLTVFVGTAFALFFAPLIASRILDVPFSDLQTTSAITYGCGMVGNAVVPILINRAKEWASTWGKRNEAANGETQP